MNKELFLIIEEKVKIENELKEITNKLKLQVNSVDIFDLDDYNYEECRNLFEHIKDYVDDKKILNVLSEVIEKKKIEKYPELLKPTYYPEIDALNISDSEKIRLDKAARWNFRNYISESNIKRSKYPLFIKDLELLKSVNIVEKRYNFRCKSCGNSCVVIPESNLEKYKRAWKLFELEKQNTITEEQLNELDQLEKEGFFEIYFCCVDEDEGYDIEIRGEKELSDYMENVEVVYMVVKSPDLTYEKL